MSQVFIWVPRANQELNIVLGKWQEGVAAVLCTEVSWGGLLLHWPSLLFHNPTFL